MKRLTIFLLLVATSIIVNAGGREKYSINKENSTLEWTGKKVTGSHSGIIALKEGEIYVEDGKIIGGTLFMDMNSIEVTDIEDQKSNKKLRNVLIAPDFFGVKDHPLSKLVINEVESKGDNNYLIKGDLTIKNISHPVNIPAKIMFENNKIVAIGETQIDRSKYDIKYGSGSFFDSLGDKAIIDLFTVKFKVGAIK